MATVDQENAAFDAAAGGFASMKITTKMILSWAKKALAAAEGVKI